MTSNKIPRKKADDTMISTDLCGPRFYGNKKRKKGCHFQQHSKAAIHYVDQCGLFIIYPEKLSRGQTFWINLVKDLIKLFREKWSISRNFLSRKPLRIKYAFLLTIQNISFIIIEKLLCVNKCNQIHLF